jgi:GTP cyclohydrolase I
MQGASRLGKAERRLTVRAAALRIPQGPIPDALAPLEKPVPTHGRANRSQPSLEANCQPVGNPVDLQRLRAAVREILLAVGEDPDREGLRDTPDRVARMYAELFAGLARDPCEPLRKTFTEKYDEIVVVRDIEFSSLCEHHLLPFIGKAHIAYLPNGKIVGLSKLPRVVDILARRPQVQERMTQELADLLMEQLGARGVAVILEATHTCMTVRGVRKMGSICTTSAVRGAFQKNLSTRSEAISLIFAGR